MRRKTRHADQRAVTRDHLFRESLSSRKMSDFLFEASGTNPARPASMGDPENMAVPDRLQMAFNRMSKIFNNWDLGDAVDIKFPGDSKKRDELKEDVATAASGVQGAIKLVAQFLKKAVTDDAADAKENLLAAAWLGRLIDLVTAMRDELGGDYTELTSIRPTRAKSIVDAAFAVILLESRLVRGRILLEDGTDPLANWISSLDVEFEDANKSIRVCFEPGGLVLKKLYVFVSKSTRFSIETIITPKAAAEIESIRRILLGVKADLARVLNADASKPPAVRTPPAPLRAAVHSSVVASPASGDEERPTVVNDTEAEEDRSAAAAEEKDSSATPASTAAPKKSLKAILGVGDDEAKKILPRVLDAGLSVSGLRDILTPDQIERLVKALEDPEREMRADLANTFTESRRHRGETIDSLVRGMRASSSHAWEDAAHRRIWTSVGEEILREHLSGKKTLISEACFRAYVHVDDRLLAETAGRLDEGIISSAAEKIGSFFAKTFGKAFGGTKSRNWAIFGGGGEKETLRYRKAYLDGIKKSSDVLGKLSNATVRDIAREIETKNPEFPNGGTAEEFKSSIAGIWDAYRMIRIAAGDPLDADKESQDFGELQQITGDDANKAIRGLRQILQGYERELKDRYTYNMESRTRKMPTLVESLLLEKSEDAEGLGSYGQKASGVKGLESNLAPGILAGLGAAGVGFSWLTRQSFFMNMFANPAAAKDMVQIFTKTVGVTKQLAFLMGKPDANLSGMKLSEFLAEMTQRGLVENGKPSAELLQMARDAGNTQFAEWWAQNLAGKSRDATLAKLIPLSSSGASGAGGDILTKRVQNVVGQQVAEIGKLSATGTLVSSLGPLAGYLGAGALLAAGAVKSLRMFGRKNSRSAWIQALLDEMKDVENGNDLELPELEELRPAGIPTSPSSGMKAKLTDSKTIIAIEPGKTEPPGVFLPKIIITEFPKGSGESLKNKILKDLEDALKSGERIDPAEGSEIADILRLDLTIEDERTLPAAAPAGEKKKLSDVLGMDPSQKNKRIFRKILTRFDDAQISVTDSGLSDDDKKRKLASALEDHEEKLRDRLENTFVAESHDRKSAESIIIERWQRLAGIIK